jgi:Skp family chaperone for outer membrane proteins
MVTLGLALYAGSRLLAEPEAGAAAPTMKVRVVNLQYVIKNYKRMESLRKEHTDLFQQYDAQLKKIKSDLDGRMQQAQDPKLAAQKDALEKEVKRLQREMQEKTEDARAALEKKQGEMVVLVYREVEEAVKTYARTANLEMVLHYNDATNEPDHSNPMNVVRKINQGACMPMYLAPGMDISQEIINALNAKYPATTAAAPTGGSGG